MERSNPAENHKTSLLQKIAKFSSALLIVTIIFNISYFPSNTANASSGAPSFSFKFGTAGSENGEFQSPRGIALDLAGNVYVVDTLNNRVQKFDPAGNFMMTFGSSGSQNGEFNHPSGIAVDTAGNIYVADTINDRIQKFDSNGNFILKFGAPGSKKDGYFKNPYGIAVDNSENVYVADTLNNRVQKFDSNGNFILKFGSPGTKEAGAFKNPYGIAVDGSGNIYVVDTLNDRVQKFDSAGNFILEFGNRGIEDGEFKSPYGINVDSEGNVYVVDTLNDRVQKFNSLGVYQYQFGARGTEDGDFRSPYGIAINSAGFIYVVDYGNDRVEVFGPAVPSAITDLTATAGNQSVTLSWTAPSDGNSSITNYLIIYGESGSCTPLSTFITLPSSCSSINTGSTSTSAIISNLINGVNYIFAVYAVNSIGIGPISNPTATAMPVGPPPTVTSGSPTSGPTYGGTSVTFTGTNLNGVTSITFDGILATNIIHIDDQHISVIAPAHPGAGTVNVVFTDPISGIYTFVGGYQYIVPLTDAHISSFTANPTLIASDGIAYSTLQIILFDTYFQPQSGKTVTINHDGTDVTLTPVLCPSTDATVAGVSDSSGQICYHISSGTRQTIQLTATENSSNVLLSASPQITFGLPFADPNLSTVGIRNQYIEPINGDAYDFLKYSGYNASYLKVTLKSATNILLPYRQVYLNPEITNAFIVHQVDCDNPVLVIAADNKTDSFGRACFLIYKDSQLTGNASNTTVSVSVDEANNVNTVLASHPGITTTSLANLNLFNFRFRNDDGNEMTATPVDNINVPYYNLDPSNPFRLRMNMSRVNNYNLFQDSILNNLTEHVDELSPMITSDIGPRPLPTYGGENGPQDFRAFTGMAVNTATHILYVPTADHTDSTIRIYKYNTDNISQAPTYFDIPSVDLTGNINNVFIDSANNLMYFVLSPGGSTSVKIYKVNLNTENVINILTQSSGNDFKPVSHDAEIDLANGFMYVTISGYAGEGNSYAHVIKIKLNGPTQDATKMGVLNIANTTDPINASVIDATNKFLYLAYGNNFSSNAKIAKIDLNVDTSLPPVKVDEIDLIANPDQSPNQQVGEQSAVIDTVNGYAYFGSSSDSPVKAFITKVDIDPNRSFEVVARLQTSDPSFATTDTLIGAEYFNFPAAQHVGTTAQIDVANQYAYFIAAHQNFTIGYTTYKVYRVDLTNFSHSNDYDELNYPSPNTQSIKANVFVPSLGKGFIIRNHLDGDQVTEYNGATRSNFRLQSARNIDPEYCNQINDPNYLWSDLPNSDFTMQASTNLVDGDPTSNVSGLLTDNNDSFIPGEVRDATPSTSTIILGRKNFTEIEYSLKAAPGAKGSYCLRLIDNDAQNDHQTGANPNYISGRQPSNYSALQTNYYVPLTINGLVLSKTSVNVIEGTTTDNYGIKLAYQPTGTVTINILAEDNRLKLTPDATPESPTQTFLTFTPENWNTYQYVTVTAPANTTIDGTTNALIHHTVNSADPAYNNIFVRPISSSVTDYGATTSNVIANVSGTITMTTPGDFSFPNAASDQNTPNFSPDLSLSVEDSRGSSADYTVTLQASPFCKAPAVCIPLDKVYLASSDLVNAFSTFNAAEIGQFIANYLQTGSSLTDISTYIHSNSAEDRQLSAPITLIDTRDVPSGNNNNPLQGSLTFLIHLMIDYANIPTLEFGTYTTNLTFDLNPTP